MAQIKEFMGAVGGRPWALGNLLTYPTGIFVNPTGAIGNAFLHGGVRRLSCMTSQGQVLTSFSAKHYDVNVEVRSRPEHFLTTNVDESLNAVVRGRVCKK